MPYNKAYKQAMDFYSKFEEDRVKLRDTFANLLKLKGISFEIGEVGDKDIYGKDLEFPSLVITDKNAITSLLKKMGYTQYVMFEKCWKKNGYGRIAIDSGEHSYCVQFKLSLNERGIDNEILGELSALDANIARTLGVPLATAHKRVNVKQVFGKFLEYIRTVQYIEIINDYFYRYKDVWLYITDDYDVMFNEVL